MRTNKLIVFACGFCCVFLGDLLYMRMNAKKGRLTNFQRFLFGTGAVYVVTVVAELVKFYLDYYIPGSALQGYRLARDPAALFFRIFGAGLADARRDPLLEINFNFLCMALGGAAGGAVLLVILEIVSRRGKNGAGMLYGYRFCRVPPGVYIKQEYETFAATVSYPEYATWWVVRIAMVCALVRRIHLSGFDMSAFLMAVNLSVTFIVPLARLLFFGKLFFGRIPFRVQTWINVFVFTGSFLGHGCDLAGTDFDKLLHVISGGLTVFIGYALIVNTRESDRLAARVCVCGAAGFSFVVMIVWEIFEFFADHLIAESYNQNYIYDPSPDMFFFRLFGRGADNPGQLPVLDTNIDLVCAVAGCAVCAVILWAILRLKRKSADRSAEREKSSAAVV